MWKLTVTQQKVYADGYKTDEKVSFQSDDIGALLVEIMALSKIRAKATRFEIKEVQEDAETV